MRSNNIKRIVSLIIVSVLVLTCFAGCGKASKNTKTAGDGENGGANLSKAEYVGLLGETFGYDEYISDADIYSDVSSQNAYYNEIQSLSEWKIINDTGEFMPDKEVTLQYALEAAVKAVGLDNISDSGETVDESDLMDFYVSNIAAIDISDPGNFVSEKTARQIIGYALEYSYSLELPQVEQVEFAQGVKDATDDIKLYADGASGKFGESNEYQVGNIIYFDATDTSIAKAVEVTEINGDEFRYTEAEYEDVFEEVEISGTYDCTLVSARSVSDSTVVQSGKQLYNEILETGLQTDDFTVMPLKNPTIDLNTGSDSIVCSVNYSQKGDKTSEETGTSTKTSVNLNANIGIKNIKAKVDVKYQHGLKRAKIELDYDTFADATLSGSFSKTIPLGEFILNVAGPLNVKIQLKAHIGADGEISVSYTTVNMIDLDYKKDSGLKHNVNCTPECTYEIDAAACLEASLYADLRLGSWSVVNADVTTGVAMNGKLEGDILEGTYNLDIDIWIPLRFNINDQPCLVTKVFKNAKISKTIWDSKTSPFKWIYHEDNLDEIGQEEEVEEIVDEKGEPIDEMEEFDFEPLEFDFIELSAYIMFMNQGETQKIGLSNIPDDYTESDILYESEDTSVCTVSADGTVMAVGEGATLVTVTTSDRTTTAKIAIIVGSDLSVDFEPL